jgi:hypothetical protein
VIAYKFLRPEGVGVFTGFGWPLPGDGGPGEWVEAPIEQCGSGIHACRLRDLPYWVTRALYEIELAGEVVEGRKKVVATRGRLVRRIEAWDDEARDAYVDMCAARGHELAQSASLPAWEAVIEPSRPEGPALLGFIAARIAEEIDGVDAYFRERKRQVEWLAERLALPAE